jgi:3',5'-cyclic AMP phosphodiesterase CpdA
MGETADGGDSLKRLVPGNHDVPLSTFLEADERCVLRDRLD